MHRGIGDIGLEGVPDPQTEAPTDAVVRITTTAFWHGPAHGQRHEAGLVFEHEAIVVVEEVDAAMNMNLTVVPGNCSHCCYVLELFDIVASGRTSAAPNFTQALTSDEVLDAFDHREAGWVKRALTST